MFLCFINAWSYGLLNDSMDSSERWRTVDVGINRFGHCTLSMATKMLNLDKFRSTRTRIAKRTSVLSVPSCPSSISTPIASGVFRSRYGNATDVNNGNNRGRDWSEHLRQVDEGQRVIFVGHNPSVESWKQCIPYAHRSNWFWKVMNLSLIHI